MLEKTINISIENGGLCYLTLRKDLNCVSFHFAERSLQFLGFDGLRGIHERQRQLYYEVQVSRTALNKCSFLGKIYPQKCTAKSIICLFRSFISQMSE